MLSKVLPIHAILALVRKDDRDNAEHLLAYIHDCCENLSWNEQGELVVHGEPIKGSHIVELVFDAMRKMGAVSGKTELWNELEKQTRIVPFLWPQSGGRVGERKPPPPGLPPQVNKRTL